MCGRARSSFGTAAARTVAARVQAAGGGAQPGPCAPAAEWLEEDSYVPQV